MMINDVLIYILKFVYIHKLMILYINQWQNPAAIDPHREDYIKIFKLQAAKLASIASPVVSSGL